ncbi:hypothetical protein L6164_032235 [Bauhinia variegata]|uniref:Uncharacterized protein n=1 Tax=Bauhinia variegata TaxID=167791 RepID=A0ACB9KN65_BAUVA|nr:hypothetical protein L6164_032235 [Bauhinia variegata]
MCELVVTLHKCYSRIVSPDGRYVSESLIPAKYAYVGLSTATTERFKCKFQHQVSALHGWVPDFIGDYMHNSVFTISAAPCQLLGYTAPGILSDGFGIK